MNGRWAFLRPSPNVFSVVMATGILSIGAARHGYVGLSSALGVLASAGLVVLVALVVATAVIERRAAVWDLRDPDITLRLFTFVAACAVLDSRLERHPVWVRVLGLVALVSWSVLSSLTVRNMLSRRWTELRDKAHGAWLLASVGTSGLVIVMAQMIRATGHTVWLAVAIPIWVAGIGVYLMMATLIMWRTVHERMDRDGFEPDTWILMGGMAIATLAGDLLGQLTAGPVSVALRAATVITWGVATVWIPPLIYFVLHRIHNRPGMLQFRGVWWALVFPLGMYSVASQAMAVELTMPALDTVSLVFFWDAFAAWLIVALAGFRRATLRSAQLLAPTGRVGRR
ncbi:tellurite resistance/C4-dicarboxylate transporter family protein [Mycolicibacillus parakoreensis]|uniref:Tellurite resistance/C4-dicarboxylate transporter family protein n=1 Tax=Mycolicibacillus parakoreensis TaxID=1069221 RepID=A0ABY3U794_9MYCO|nr:tellurite resistance/C4-dicarboxylate transporter family protein [Mycolicibacillus parakoreensis]MCV7314364.1 tellurite resistance/C4-dicarboxylate transporter family protein [Mycolicibacillus parakoreensis]ULN53289.1 tellurite resistance/C4-dicarboxylate transporter family protein [Mycolicibacillus parakoreensis]